MGLCRVGPCSSFMPHGVQNITTNDSFYPHVSNKLSDCPLNLTKNRAKLHTTAHLRQKRMFKAKSLSSSKFYTSIARHAHDIFHVWSCYGSCPSKAFHCLAYSKYFSALFQQLDLYTPQFLFLLFPPKHSLLLLFLVPLLNLLPDPALDTDPAPSPAPGYTLVLKTNCCLT